jgi:ABC-2 type transport system permease protein
MNTLLRLTVANIKSLVRDRAALFWTIFFPIMFVFLFGWIFGGNGSNGSISIGFVDQDNSPASAQLHSSFSGVPVLSVSTGSLDDEKAAMQKGDISAIVVVPAGFADAITKAKTTGSAVAIGIYTDPTKTQTAQIVQGIATQIANGYNLAIQSAKAIVVVGDPQSLSSNALSNVGYLVPSILAMALMQLGVFAALPLVQQRQQGILKRIGATPLPRWKLVASNILLRLILAAVDTVLIIGIGIAFFGIQITGNVLAAAGFVFLGAGAFLALGFALASYLKTEEQATGVVQVVQMPMMFLSGIFFPFDLLPGFLKTVARFMPLTYLGDGLRQTMVNGTEFAPLAADAAILGGWLVVCLVVAARSFRWE